MSISRIQSGDNVKIISGKYKNHVGTIISIRKDKVSGKVRVAVSGVENIAKFQKANRQYGVPGELKQVPRYLDASNVALLDEKGKISKITIKTDEQGKRYRAYKTTGTGVNKTKLEADSSKPEAEASKKKTSKKKSPTTSNK